MAKKQLIVAVEGTAAMGSYWQTIVSDYLEKIIRSFCGNQLPEQKASTSSTGVELSLIIFSAHGSYSGGLVTRSGWTKDADTFLQWLSAIPFAGVGFNAAAIAEGLSEALMMFPIVQAQQNLNGQRHCILIAASNPYPSPTLVYRRQMENLEQSVSDAETVAKSFSQCSVSLSVICPRQLPKLRAIYNAGKRNPRAADPAVDNVKNPDFLVLISENFMEACAALRRPGVTSLASNQSPPSTSIPTGAQMVRSGGIGMNQNMTSGLGPSGFCSGTGTMIPTAGMPGMQSLGVNNNSAANMPLSQRSSTLQSAQAKYVKIWEGNLSGQKQGQSIYITRIEAYRSSSASEMPAANWPPTMQIVRLISQDHMYDRQYVGKAEFLIFRAINQHGFLECLQKRKLCAIIELPTQTLLLSGSDKARCMMGMLLPGEMVAFKQQTSSQPQEQQQLQQQQHQPQQIQSQQHLQPQQQQLPQPPQQHPQPPQQQLPQYIEISDDESTEVEMTDAAAPVQDSASAPVPDLASAVRLMHKEALSLRCIQIPHDKNSKMLLDFVERFVNKFRDI